MSERRAFVPVDPNASPEHPHHPAYAVEVIKMQRDDEVTNLARDFSIVAGLGAIAGGVVSNFEVLPTSVVLFGAALGPLAKPVAESAGTIFRQTRAIRRIQRENPGCF